MVERVKWDGTQEDKLRLIEENAPLRLLEEQRYKKGKWLVFTDEPETPPDYKALYAQAKNDTERQEVIAKKLELI